RPIHDRCGPVGGHASSRDRIGAELCRHRSRPHVQHVGKPVDVAHARAPAGGPDVNIDAGLGTNRLDRDRGPDREAAHKGTWMVKRVPPSGADSTVTSPPLASTRSRMLIKPRPFPHASSTSNPRPSSATVNVRRPLLRLNSTDTSDAALYFAAFCSVSWTTRNRHNVSSGDNVSGTPSWTRCTGRPERTCSC